MISSQFDVVIVGAGCAGLTAALGLVKAGFRVAVVEAAAYPGAENWSGCVYFCENLAHPAILGPGGVEALAWERRLVERGFFTSDGHSLMGMKYRDPDAFRHCYTVLRPIFDHHLGQLALKHGVALLTETTAESLIREARRVIGVATNRGPLYADLVFLAEGDASHLVTKEGYERFTDPRDAPKFLQGIKQVIELPPGAVEEIFGVSAEEGVAYEMLLRNGTLRGQSVHLNMGGFLYTNRQSLSLGLVLPADNLSEHFAGDPNLLMEWFENLPALRPWLKAGQRGVFGAKIIRGGGAKDIPTLIDDGLAIGGAASAVGIDFPYPNFTGPATAMGLLLTQAAVRLREAGEGFTRENLRRHYLEPLQRTHYWKDVEFLRHWPGYVKKTRVFFDRNIDLALGTAYVWSRPGSWLLNKWSHWLRLLLHEFHNGNWRGIQSDLRHLVRALRLREARPTQPALGRLLLDGTLNALRDLVGAPRANLGPAGTLRLHYSIGGDTEPAGAAPSFLRRWFTRFSPVLAAAARQVYANDDTPLAVKLPRTTNLLLKQLNILDLLATAGFALAAAVAGGWLAVAGRFLDRFRHRLPDQLPRGIYPRYAAAAARAGELTAAAVPAAQAWDARLAQLSYDTERASHIHVLWPQALQEKNKVVAEGLWNVCPAHVYEARVSPLGQLQVVVNFENCIKCETCWRTSDIVDWGRDGQHRFTYPVVSPVPVMGRLLADVQGAGLARPMAPKVVDPWHAEVLRLERLLLGESRGTANGGSLFADAPDKPARNGQMYFALAEAAGLLDKLEHKLSEFDAALAEEPRTVDRTRAEHLEMLARYAQQVAGRALELLRDGGLGEHPSPALKEIRQRVLGLATALFAKAEERARRTWDRRFAWAAADGRQLRQHHLVGLRRLMPLVQSRQTAPAELSDPSRAWLQAEANRAAVADTLAQLRKRLDEVFPPNAWRDIDRGTPVTQEQDARLREVVTQIPAIDPARLEATLHPPLRKAVLAELGRRDPALAYRAACHLWARDLAQLAATSSVLSSAAARWTRGDEWACFAQVDAASTHDGRWTGEALFVPATGAASLLLLVGDQLAAVPTGAAGLHLDPLATLGLRGAGLVRVRLDQFVLPETRVPADHERLRRLWGVLSAADLTSIAYGMTDVLCERAATHATSRVQFPGLFHDENARDTIGKFGAVKKMVAEIGAARYLLETLDHALAPVDFSSASVERAGLVKALAADALGTAPGSVAYNAGQVFGGTAYSEDDILSKYYRDAAAWRYLGPANVDVFRQHGESLLRHWRTDGQKLAGVRDEGLLFDQLAQRQALQAELDEVRVLRSRLRSLVNDWHTQDFGSLEDFYSLAGVEVVEGLGRQDAALLATKALLLRTHARLEHGHPAQTEKALLRVWLDGAAAALDELDAVARAALDPAALRSERPVVEPSHSQPPTVYAEFLKAEAPYDSGDFLNTPVNLSQPRLLPEMLADDPELAEADRNFRRLLAAQFGQPRGGVPYERHIERVHRPDAEDVDYARRHGFFRMPIPRELGGEGRRKVDYYLLVTQLQRQTDASFCLTVQVNTGIGCAPIFLARDKDLPKAQKDVAPFVGDPALQKDITARLERLLYLVPYGNTKRIAKALQELQQRLDETVFARGALKALAHKFTAVWPRVVRAAQEPDIKPLADLVKQALVCWKDACDHAEEYHAELGRRREACDLFLRWVAAGQISGFALTEPSAGSDTARVATRARLRSVPVEREPDGVLRFVPFESNEPRYLLDARRLEFRAVAGGSAPDSAKAPAADLGAHYRWSDDAEPSLLHFDEYDYETDDPGRSRYYDHGGRRVHFTDIAQLRERDGKLWYDYWELTGAKMWITNGRIMGVMCLYAKTDEGVTGFLVDRHAEGLVVGKDEEKMGQCGSPTNELSLQKVRVPRENVLGLEGRGQVNALEALNVGRAGLGISSMAQLDGLIQESRAFARSTHGDVPDWAAWRLGRMEEDRFTAEALAWDVIGRFEHKQTKSVRMESAIAKMLNTELLHRVIELAEDIHGLAGQTQLHTVEKRKRDARVLNIYEGTNEIQRSLILKDLAAELAPRWTRNGPPPIHVGREAIDLETVKTELKQRVRAVLDVFGSGVWQNPNLQSNCFLLAEAAAWVKAADSTLARLAWLERREQVGSGEWGVGSEGPSLASQLTPHASLPIPIGRRAFTRCLREVRQRLRRFDEELAHLRRGFYAATVPAAVRLFDQSLCGPAEEGLKSQILEALTALVIVEPTTASVPRPHVAEGQLLEPHYTLSDADEAALETALRLRDMAPEKVAVHIAAVAPKGAGQMLQQLLGLGVQRVRLVYADRDGFTADSAAGALAAVLREGRFDLVLSGAAAGGEEGLLGVLTAEKLGVHHAGRAASVTVCKTANAATVLLANTDGRHARSCPLPAAVAMEVGLSLRSFSVGGYLAGLGAELDVDRWPRKVKLRPVRLAGGAQAAPTTEEPPRVLDPHEAAGHFKQWLGLDSGGPARAERYEGPIVDVTQPALADGGVLAVIAADIGGQLLPGATDVLRAARAVARADAAELTVLLAVAPDPEVERRAISQVHDSFSGRLLLLSASGVEASGEMRSRVLRECWSALAAQPLAVLGEAWAEAAFAALGARADGTHHVAVRVRRLALEEGHIILDTTRAQGKLRARQTMHLHAGATWWLSLAPDAEVSGEPPRTVVPPRVERWTPHLGRLFARDDMQRLLQELTQEIGLVRLTDADFILDVGFGVGNRDGYEEVVEPLERALRELGVKNLAVGGSRKVTEELHLLPLDRQIGQSGVSVNPQVLLALGVSGAPQHLNYIGPRATILAFNRDPEAPLLTLNQRQPRPRVFPVVGDLFVTVPAFITALRAQAQGAPGVSATGCTSVADASGTPLSRNLPS